MTKTVKSIAQLNPQVAAGQGHEFEIMAGDEPSGMFLTVVGRESSVFVQANRAQINADRKAQYERVIKGKPETFSTVEDDIARAVQIYGACVTGWRGVVIDEAADGPDPLPFTPENVARLLTFDFVRMQVEQEVLGVSDFTAG